MLIHCPDCLCYRTRPDPLRWYEAPLRLLAQPYRCCRCARRFFRPRWPGLPVGLMPHQNSIAR